MGRRRAQHRSGARRRCLRGAGQAERSGRSLHLPCGCPRSVQRHLKDGPKMNLLGKLSWAAIPFDQPIVMGATAFMGLFAAFILGWITLRRAWPYLWNEW